jgi:hypothetical protein
LPEYLKQNFPSEEEAEQWKKQAIVELDTLAENATEHHRIAFKSVDPKGIVLAEDTERTKEWPRISESAKGISFRA